MPFASGAAVVRAARWISAVLIAGGCVVPAARAEGRPAAAVLLDRLCAQTMRHNEEDRLYGLISLTVRTTIRYEGGVFSPDLIDDAVQDGLGALLGACPQLAKTADPERLGLAVALIRDATIRRMQDPHADYNAAQTEKATAADLSEELSAPEIDAWLDALPPRQRALAVSLYASAATPREIAAALGLPAGGVDAALRGVKTDLLQYYRADWNAAPPPPVPSDPPLEYREAAQPLAALLAPQPTSAAGNPAAKMRITGISPDIYAGWSLLATVTGLPPGRGLQLNGPILLEPDRPGHRRMIAVALDEISDPHDATRRFLLKAYALDDAKEGSGLNDGFHLGAAKIDNPAALQTLHNRLLAAIEIARCLAYDYGTDIDPGLCH